MKKIDFHIHTISTTKDQPFEFNLDTLRSYVDTRSLDAIAITNHNCFDERQFSEIKHAINCTVFPGIEIDLDKGHILVISPLESVSSFISECTHIKEHIETSKSLSVNEFLSFFPNIADYLVIPHYTKDPKIPASIIQQLSRIISAGEVDSPKKWERCHKDDERLTPVLFSDMRACDFTGTKEFSTRQTYIDIDEIDIPILKIALKDRQNVFLSEDRGQSIFQLSNDDVLASTGLNVIIGKRSSGKSYTLESIANDYPYCSKYIRQFGLVEKNNNEEFNETINKRHKSFSHKYLEELRNIVELLLSVDQKKSKQNLERYVHTLKAYADSESMSDIFSQCKLFIENPKVPGDLKATKKLVEATLALLESDEYFDLIESIIPRQTLIKL